MLRPAVAISSLALACAAPVRRPDPPLVPEPLRFERLAPAATPPARPPANLERYDDEPIDAGRCPGLPAGILVSDARYAEGIAVLSERNRLRAEAAALRTLASTTHDQAEALTRLLRERERLHAETEDRLERDGRLRGWLGLAVGAGAVLLGGWAVGRVAR